MDTHDNHQVARIVGANLKAARGNRTQKQIADEIGVTPKDVSRWENGWVEPGPKYRYLLAKLLFDGDLSAMYAEPKEEVAA